MKIGGANAPPTNIKRPRKRGWPRFRGHGVARWPHQVGAASSFGDFSLSSSGFPVSVSEFDKTAFDLWLQPLDLG